MTSRVITMVVYFCIGFGVGSWLSWVLEGRRVSKAFRDYDARMAAWTREMDAWKDRP